VNVNAFRTIMIRIQPYNCIETVYDKILRPENIMNAVITADIIDYSKLPIAGEDLVINTIYDTFEDGAHLRTNLDSSIVITRGDNIQIELDHHHEALKAALLLKTAINKITLNKGNKNKIEIDIRIVLTNKV